MFTVLNCDEARYLPRLNYLKRDTIVYFFGARAK